MLEIVWSDRVTNEEVSGRIKEKRQIWKVITKRSGNITGHKLRHDSLMRLIIEGYADGKTGRGRPGQSYRDLKESNCDRDAWRAFKINAIRMNLINVRPDVCR